MWRHWGKAELVAIIGAAGGRGATGFDVAPCGADLGVADQLGRSDLVRGGKQKKAVDAEASPTVSSRTKRISLRPRRPGAQTGAELQGLTESASAAQHVGVDAQPTSPRERHRPCRTCVRGAPEIGPLVARKELGISRRHSVLPNVPLCRRTWSGLRLGRAAGQRSDVHSVSQAVGAARPRLGLERAIVARLRRFTRLLCPAPKISGHPARALSGWRP